MHNRMLKPRAGFTLAEMLIALTLTAVLGATITGAFVSQSRFFDKQEKVGAARSVARAGTNLLLADLRMVEASGVTAATNTSVTVHVPYALGLACSYDGSNGKLRISQLPVDSLVLATAEYSGLAYRNGNTYVYPSPAGKPSSGSSSVCTTAGVAVLPTAEGGRVIEVPSGPLSLKTGTPVFLYQTITYSFKPSTSVPGRMGLYRKLESASSNPEQELAAPFAPGAGFRFFVDYSGTSQSTVPSPLSSITGLEIALDGLSERPNSDGTNEAVEHVTAVFFKNR
jgi:prepilin-type N-terminal cleavage/methylation domain-containing protein